MHPLYTVPILPHFVHHEVNVAANETWPAVWEPDGTTSRPSRIYSLLKSSAEHFHIGRGYQPEVGDNTRLGFLLSLKAVVQLAANPLVAVVTQRRGFALPLLVGSVNISLCSLRTITFTSSYHKAFCFGIN